MLASKIKQSNLKERSNQFVKLSGMLEAPPHMLEYLSRKAERIFSGMVLNFIESKEEKTTEDIKIIKEAIKYSNRQFSLDHEIIVNVPLNLDGWRHFNNKMVANKQLIPNTLTAIFSPKQHAKNDRGTFDFNDNIIRLYLSNIHDIINLNEFNYQLFDLLETVRHELQHYSQLLFYYLVGDSGDFYGKPPVKVRSREKETEDTLHPLKDIEFYTNLQDSINSFKKEVFDYKISKKNIKDFALSWIGASQNFYNKEHKRIEEEYNNLEKEQELHSLFQLSKIRYPFNILINKDFNKWKLAVKVFLDKIDYMLP